LWVNAFFGLTLDCEVVLIASKRSFGAARAFSTEAICSFNVPAMRFCSSRGWQGDFKIQQLVGFDGTLPNPTITDGGKLPSLPLMIQPARQNIRQQNISD
jgi:hypothetical protein